MRKLSNEEIEKIYNLITDFHKKYLIDFGVSLSRLKNADSYTKSALVLVYLAQDYPATKIISKAEITEFIRTFYPNTNDVQDARHLGMQKGWYIASGTRGNGVEGLHYGDYQLITLEKPHPNFRLHRKVSMGDADWEAIKEKYNYRCVTCGSKEGELNYHYPGTITKLTQAHMDPNKELTPDNIIPQCDKCNRPDRNYWIYDRKGRVVKIAHPQVVIKSDKTVRWEIYKVLYEEFKGVNPNE